MGHVIVVCGLEREGRVLGAAGLRIIPGGGNAERLAERLAREADGADGIISFGMAGALDPSLKLGDWVIGDTVISSPSPSGEGLGVGSVDLGQPRQSRTNPTPTPPLKGRGFGQACDPVWTAALARRLPDARIGPIYADGHLIADPDEKSALGASGALAADMESHIAARAAAEAGLPFAIVRCISDEAGHALPPAIAVAMRPDGGLALGAILKSIIRNPSQALDLLKTSANFKRAYVALRQGAQQIGPRLAFDLR